MEVDKINNQDPAIADLLEIIQRHLPPAERERLDYLLLKNEVDELSESEQNDFIVYADQIEHEGAERARGLLKLAQIRNVEPAILLEEFFPA